MGRAELLSALATCDGHLAQNERNITDQEKRISFQEAVGIDVSASQALLQTFKQLRHFHQLRHASILSELAVIGKAWPP
jgi:hypothetical protein